MIGEHVMTEHDTLSTRVVSDPVGMGSYDAGFAHVQRYITPEGFVQNEGDVGVHTKGPYKIAFGSIVPKREPNAGICWCRSAFRARTSRTVRSAWSRCS